LFDNSGLDELRCVSSAQDQPSSVRSVVAHRSTGGSDVAFHTRHGDKYHGRKKEEGCKEGWKEKGCEEEVSSLPPTKKAGAPRRLFLLRFVPARSYTALSRTGSASRVGASPHT
jgi:hypothetical protein